MPPESPYSAGQASSVLIRLIDCEAHSVTTLMSGDHVVSAEATVTETSGQALNDVMTRVDASGRLRLLAQAVSGTIVFTTRFGLEDQALTT